MGSTPIDRSVPVDILEDCVKTLAPYWWTCLKLTLNRWLQKRLNIKDKVNMCCVRFYPQKRRLHKYHNEKQTPTSSPHCPMLTPSSVREFGWLLYLYRMANEFVLWLQHFPGFDLPHFTCYLACFAKQFLAINIWKAFWITFGRVFLEECQDCATSLTLAYSSHFCVHVCANMNLSGKYSFLSII